MAKIKLTLAEMCWLVAVYGDIPESQRARLFSISRFPEHVELMSLIMQDGRDFISQNRKVERRPRRSVNNPLFDTGW